MGIRDSRFMSIGAYLAALVTLMDQVSKWWILNEGITRARPVRVTSFFNLTLSWNKGVTFGMFNQLGPWMPYVLVAVAVLIIALLLNWLRQASNFYAGLGLGLIMGGAVGNVIDRLRYGAVVDFLDFHYAGYHWYTFNIADCAIVLGVGLLLLENLLAGRKRS